MSRIISIDKCRAKDCPFSLWDTDERRCSHPDRWKSENPDVQRRNRYYNRITNYDTFTDFPEWCPLEER